MANIVIVTRACYLLCEAINHISVNEASDECKKEEAWSASNRRGRKKKKKPSRPTKAMIAQKIQNAPYQIIIDFVPVSRGNPNQQQRSSTDESTTVAITVYGRDRCLALFAEMVEQIREQLPDQMFLDKIVEKLLGEVEGDKND